MLVTLGNCASSTGQVPDEVLYAAPEWYVLCLPSLPLHRVRTSQRVRIYKVVRVIDGHVLVSLLGEAVVGLPAIGDDDRPEERSVP